MQKITAKMKKLVSCNQRLVTHKILKGRGLKMIKLSKKTLIWPCNQLKRFEFCKQMVSKGPAFWKSVIWSDETTVRQRPQGKKIEYRVHSSAKKEDLPQCAGALRWIFGHVLGLLLKSGIRIISCTRRKHERGKVY